MGHCNKSVREAMLVSAEEYNYLLRGYNESRQAQYEIARWMSYNSMML